MLYRILPSKITDILDKRLNVERIYELRFRSGKAVSINYGGTFYYLSKDGLSSLADNSVTATPQMLQDIVVKASDYSLYTVNRNLCDGFITVEGGVRIGITGEYVWENDAIKTIKNFSGLTVRIPHEVKGCADKLIRPLTAGGVKNSLIISPPACGKTTLLRDISRMISSLSPGNNILLIDERSEIAACLGGVPQLDVGNNVDVISNCTKQKAILRGIRSMNPSVIITDELAESSDIDAVFTAAYSGVKIIASVHALDQYDLMNKTSFDRAVKSRLFERYAVLSNKPVVGTLSGVYDENLERLY